MVEQDNEITPVMTEAQAEPARDSTQIRKLEDEEDEIDRKIDDLLIKRKELMEKLAQLIAEENRQKMVDSGCQTATSEIAEELDSSMDKTTRSGSLFSFNRSKSKKYSSSAAGTTDSPGEGDLSRDSETDSVDASFERKKRKKTLYESLKKALSKAAQHIKNKTRRSRELQPEVTVDVGLKQEYDRRGDRRGSRASYSESDRSADEDQNANLSQELAELDALAGMAIQQKAEDQDQESKEADGEHDAAVSDELKELAAMTENLEGAKPSTEPMGVAGDAGTEDPEATEETNDSNVGPLAAELRGMLNQISNIGAESESAGVDETVGSTYTAGQDNDAPVDPLMAAGPAASAADGDVEESGADMLQSQLQDMLAQLGNLGEGLTVTGAGDC